VLGKLNRALRGWDRDAGNGCRLRQAMQNVSEVNLHSIPLARTNRGMPELRKFTPE
jgi:hypothetical protein